MTDKDILLHMVRKLEEENQRLKKDLFMLSKYIFINYPNNTKLLKATVAILAHSIYDDSEEKQK